MSRLTFIEGITIYLFVIIKDYSYL